MVGETHCTLTVIVTRSFYLAVCDTQTGAHPSIQAKAPLRADHPTGSHSLQAISPRLACLARLHDGQSARSCRESLHLARAITKAIEGLAMTSLVR